MAMRSVARLAVATVALSIVVDGQSPDRAIARIAYADVQPLWDSLKPQVPAGLAGKSADEMAEAWTAWVRAHDLDVRARVARGDEDSLVNLWLFGTSFTEQPPARPRDVALNGEGATLAQIAERRLDDLARALTAPGSNERLRWARQFFSARGIDPGSPRGEARLRELLAAVGKRMLSENADFGRALEQPNAGSDPLAWMLPYASLYRDRGLSSDTSLLSSFGVDATLEALSTSGMMPAGTIRRVAIVGPGLDFLNKADGHDFYPEQTIQPFAIVDSLIRAGLSRAGEVSVTTFDVSARVNQHLAAARDRAGTGVGYVLQLPLSDAERWSAALVRYWERAGDRVGDAVRASPPPRSASAVKVRAVRVRPEVVRSIVPRDLNIVVERLDPLPESERFDLVVATNVFVYYDAFEQALAMINIGRMLRSGGSLLSNQALRPVAPMKPAVGHDTIVYSDRQFDHLFWYQRQ
jgi:SAM-dependent methyltransferase